MDKLSKELAELRETRNKDDEELVEKEEKFKELSEKD